MGISILKGYTQVQTSIGAIAPTAPVAPVAPATQGDFSTGLASTLTVSKNALALRQPKEWVDGVYEKQLDRHATAKELKAANKTIAPVIKRHGTVAEAKQAIADRLKQTDEYKLVHNDGWVNSLFKRQLERKATAKDQKWADAKVAPVIKRHGSVESGRKAVAAAIKKTPAYKKLHPTISKNRDAIYIAQPNGWTCGPTSLTMALKALCLRPNNQTTINEMVRRTGTNSNDGVPGNASLIANAAKSVGAQATYSASGSPDAVRAALKRGHGVVLNGSLGTGGHFIYVAGLDKDGRFIICDPWRSSITCMSDSELNHFANTYSNPRGFAEIWR